MFEEGHNPAFRKRPGRVEVRHRDSRQREPTLPKKNEKLRLFERGGVFERIISFRKRTPL